MLTLVISSLSFLVMTGCGISNQDSGLTEAIDYMNDPSFVLNVGDFDKNISNMPKVGRSEREIWTGSYWPLSSGGLKGPLSKLDQVTNGQGLATSWEQGLINKNVGVSWAGHCNGLAAAGSMSQKPKRGVNYRGVYFTQEDIEGLLVAAWDGSSDLIGGRCEGQIAKDELGRIIDPKCRGINPGAFHLALGNYLGRYGISIIVDKSVGAPVWNYPISSYRVTQQESLTMSAAESLVTGNGGQNYRFNDQATNFLSVKLTIILANGVSKNYHYVLELDQYRQVLGGEWVGHSKVDHPDFIWKLGSAQPSNPYVDLNVVKEIYLLSI